ncbi:MAG: hypothetical protein JRN37_09330 [Nitrososphaerota archaeon]|jgi:hypothetical protein|nr:hypothetical protein [Nitrososphaerota archaeon]
MVESRFGDDMKEIIMKRAAIARSFTEAINPRPVTQAFNTIKSSNKLGNNMIKVGIAIIAIPDPISDLPGAGLVVMGYMLKKASSIGLNDLSCEINRTRAAGRELLDIVQDLSQY